jgi:hypothetical protein
MALNIHPLAQEQRQLAYQAAQEAIVPAARPKPTREQLHTHPTISRCPLAITRLISGFCLSLPLAAVTPSAIRDGRRCRYGSNVCRQRAKRRCTRHVPISPG